MAMDIRFKQVGFAYQAGTPFEMRALHDVTFSVKDGSYVAIIGHTGSGKSTILQHLNALLKPTEGIVELGDKIIDSTTGNKDLKPLRKKVGMVFQNPDNQFVGTTVEDDIAFGLENIGMPRDEMVRKINTSLEMVRMTKFKEKEPARLSGGQKQRVAIAGMIALAPKVVILDEATSMLDPQGRFEVISTIQQLHKDKGITVISITHDLDEAAQADRVLLMEGGKVNRIGKPSEIFEMGTALVDKGLDVPFSEKLKAILKEKGMNVPNEYLDEEGLVEWLWTSVLNK